jgi:nitroreductase
MAAWQAVLMAESLGLGSCVNGLIPPACNKVPELRSLLGLPEGNEVHACLTLGWPKVKYRKTIRRHLAEARYV